MILEHPNILSRSYPRPLIRTSVLVGCARGWSCIAHRMDSILALCTLHTTLSYTLNSPLGSFSAREIHERICISSRMGKTHSRRISYTTETSPYCNKWKVSSNCQKTPWESRNLKLRQRSPSIWWIVADWGSFRWRPYESFFLAFCLANVIKIIWNG